LKKQAKGPTVDNAVFYQQNLHPVQQLSAENKNNSKRYASKKKGSNAQPFAQKGQGD